MSVNPSPREILATLLPHLRLAAGYARQIQTKIATLPAKGAGDNFFAAALTDADLSIQTLVEVALLAKFPRLSFYGEEYEQSRNTKYFGSTTLGRQDDYLITLDPIDGTKFYLDGFDNYQIILSILNRDHFEAAIAISPAQDCYYYALRGEGIYRGSLDADLDDCIPWRLIDGEDRRENKTIINPKPVILLGWGMAHLKPALIDKYQVIDLENCYSSEIKLPNYNGIFSGDIIGWATKRGKFIDSAAIAFMSQEAGCIVTDFNGLSLASLHTCQDYSYNGAVVGASKKVHQDLLSACQNCT
jgi:fructose-1,6-bisphosphatase/inositol monophosphatase family enzyme